MQSALSFDASVSKEQDRSSKPTLEQLRNSFALPVTASSPNPLSATTQFPCCLHDCYHQQQQQQLAAPYLGTSGVPTPQGQCSPSLPTALEHFAQPGATAAIGTTSAPYSQFHPYFPPPHAFYFPGAQQHVSPQFVKEQAWTRDFLAIGIFMCGCRLKPLTGAGR
ncbi:unnamed protein product [Gongylonema pulchrum]|uniref:Uncharacterized protein n=1 Tax=Gongylonema pulchrum TaxID=637853 RepID=A0A3P7NC43_9BILA|nr:unnamed protein product [Gongylonema pulchrum]